MFGPVNSSDTAVGTVASNAEKVASWATKSAPIAKPYSTCWVNSSSVAPSRFKITVLPSSWIVANAVVNPVIV